MERATGDLPGVGGVLRCAIQRPYPTRAVGNRAGQPRGTSRRAIAPSARPSTAPATMSEVWCIRVYTRLAATAAASANHAGRGRAAGEQHRGGERRRRVARRERARDRAVHAVGERTLGWVVVGGPHPAEARLDRTVGEERLDAERGAHAQRDARDRPRGGTARADEQPQQPVVGRAGQAVEDRVELRARGCARPTRRSAGRARAPARQHRAEATGRRIADGLAGVSRVGDERNGVASGSVGSITVPGPRSSRGVDRVAAVRGAVGLERAEVAQAAGLGPEVVAARSALAMASYMRGRAPLDAPDRLVGGGGDDRLGLREVVELHPRRAPTEHALAQQRVDVDAGEALGLPELRRHRAGLVVGDHELAVLVELEPVDDAAQPGAAEVGLELELEADGVHRARVLELEVLAHQRLGVGVELGPLLVGEVEVGEVGVGRELDPGLRRGRRARRRSCARRPGGRGGARAPGARACPWWSTARAARGAGRGRRTGTRAGTP